MVTISLCTIFRDEEEFLPEFLDLLEDSVDELVLVDTGSVDNSLRIIKDKGHTTHYFEWINHFSKARNYCLSLATSDWILMLDVDDRIELENLQLLKAKIQNTDRDAIYVPYISITNKDWKNFKHNSTAIQNRLVAFRNHRGFHYRNPVHENIENVVEEMGGTFDFVKAPVYHLGYAEELNALKEARNKNLIQTNYEDNPSDPDNILNYCAMCWDDPQVPDLLRQVLQSGSNHQSYNAGSKLLTWMDDKGVALSDEKNIELTLLEIHARSGIVNLRRGRRFFAESKVDEALNCYQIAYEGMQFEILERLPREEILERLGLLYAMNKNLDKACETFREWELAFGRSPSSFHLLLKTLFAQRNYGTFVKEIQNPPKNLREMIPERLEELRNFLSVMQFDGQTEILNKFCESAGIETGKV